MELYRLANNITVDRAIKAGKEVVKQNKDPKLTSLIYPLLQSLDEKFLDVDFELGGVDQKNIFALSMDFLKREKISYLINPIIPELSSNNVNTSDEYTKINLLDHPNVIVDIITKLIVLKEKL